MRRRYPSKHFSAPFAGSAGLRDGLDCVSLRVCLVLLDSLLDRKVREHARAVVLKVRGLVGLARVADRAPLAAALRAASTQ